MSKVKMEKNSICELKKTLKSLGAKQSGNKKVLIERYTVQYPYITKNFSRFFYYFFIF